MQRTRLLAQRAMSARQFSTSPPCLVSPERSFPAYFVRGGTSNGLIIREDVLPSSGRPTSDVSAAAMTARAAAWAPLLAPAMGSPDPQAARQLDGMGSGVSSTSKICVISPPSSDAERADRDVNFTFVQVGIRDGSLDLAGNCGNMISVVGPLAFDLGYGGTHQDSSGKAVVRIFNTNTKKLIQSTFSVAGSPPRYSSQGDYSIDGVPGTHSRITLSFLRPAGAKTGAANGLPTGNPVDLLSPGEGEPATVQASLVDVSNPGVFVLASSLGLGEDTVAAAKAIETDPVLKAKVDHLRREGAVRMGMDPKTESVPKIVILFPPSQDTDIRCVALSMGQVHKAVPLTLALCLGAAARIPDTLASQLVETKTRGSTGSTSSSTIVIGHPSGRVDVGTTLDEADGTILSAELHRTARVLMEGKVYY
ncbi:methylitaconate delta2-delta3-isomerase [Ophiostoma piceae UAMH 11346]|uniref:Methylitaconate delta2-delta3-isomerase n=1 Tax=Ophiostoma piceae (strain UAMH 11346) TaxID=1262450 RepID=S3C606_OPHP1|nr:methylitaconate delta2-delta3-isomerase [Ophiostoma piceae UAMH 11346]